MNTLAVLVLLVRAQNVLPSPPEPTGSPEIDTVRVIGVVLVSLGVIVLLALALRPLVVRTGKSPAPADSDRRASRRRGIGSVCVARLRLDHPVPKGSHG